MVGLEKKNGHIHKNLTPNGEPQRYSWGRQKKKISTVFSLYYKLCQRFGGQKLCCELESTWQNQAEQFKLVTFEDGDVRRSRYSLMGMTENGQVLKWPHSEMAIFFFLCKMLFVGCLTSQEHANVSQGWICSDIFTCCHTEIEVADQTFYLTQSQYTEADALPLGQRGSV